jgi:hypothetical protein
MAGLVDLWATRGCRIFGFCILSAFLPACDISKSPTEADQSVPKLRREADLLTDTVPANILVRPSVRFQTITGWEAHPQSGFESPDFHLYKDSLFALAVNDLGINRLRLEIKSGAENTVDYYGQWRRGLISDSTWRCVRFATVNDNSDPNVINWNGFKFAALDTIVKKVIIPMRQRLAARGERLFINLEYVAFTSQICPGRQYHHDDSPQEYAEFILATSLYLRSKYGLIPDAWEVILEPDNTTFWRGPQIGRAIVATAAKLTANAFTPRFIAPSTARVYNTIPYFDQMLTQVPGAKPYLRELSYHRYSSTTAAELQTIGARATQNGIRAGMLEKIKGTHHELHADLKYAKVTSWQQFALAFNANDGGDQYYRIDRTDPLRPKLAIGSRTKYLRQYFRFVRNGAVRIDATTSNALIDPVAFINANGKYVVVLKSAVSAPVSFGIQALPAGTYGLMSTNGVGVTLNWPDITILAGQVLKSRIPPKAAMTIYRK